MHEAFKRQLHFTPEQFHDARMTGNLALTEALNMNSLEQERQTMQLQPPRSDHQPAMRLAGMTQHYTFDQAPGIADQWQSFAPHIPRLAGNGSPDTFGVIYNGSKMGFDYLSGVEVDAGLNVLDDMFSLYLPAQQYLVFQHADHVASLRDTCAAIWSTGILDAGFEALEAPWFERYGSSFDPMSGYGGLEVWIPVVKV